MRQPAFDENGNDPDTFAPFNLQNDLNNPWKEFILSFHAWQWLEEQYGSNTIDGYYLNGYGVEGLVKAALFANKLQVDAPEIFYNSEGGTCYIQFKSLQLAVQVAELASAMISNRQFLAEMIKIAQEQGFED